MKIPIAVTAKNEAESIRGALLSLRTSVAYAQRALGIEYTICTVLNDCTDETADIADSLSDDLLFTTGGLIAAQRAAVAKYRSADFLIFSDADIRVAEDAVLKVTQCMLNDTAIKAAYIEKRPVRPRSKGLLAKALYLYNLNGGYQTKRDYLNGQFFAIRDWDIPAGTPFDQKSDSNFLNLKAGVRCDDIYLSRSILSRYGPTAIRLVDSHLYYRCPESLQGMYRKYQRMRLEIERLDHLFPETAPAHQMWGRRKLDLNQLSDRPLTEKLFYALFQFNLTLCKVFYAFERMYFSNFARSPYQTWHPVLETKKEIS